MELDEVLPAWGGPPVDLFRLLPVVPWLSALLVFGPGEPPVPFTLPLLDIEPAAIPDELEAPEDAPPPLLPPPDPPPCASAVYEALASIAASAVTINARCMT